MDFRSETDLQEIITLKRPELITTTLGEYIYSDADKQYRPVQKPMPDFYRKVSNIESFIAYVQEVADRRNNINGNEITIIFNERGGTCYLEDGKSPDVIEYNRTLSPQWNFLVQRLSGKQYTHRELLTIIQALRPSFFDGYEEFMRQYRRVTFDASVAITSQPLITQGKTGNVIAFQLSRSGGGEGNTELPAQLLLQLQYARGSARKYTLQVEIDSELRSKGENKQEIVFSLSCPDLDNVIAEAIKDEVEDFQATISESLPDALVVVNF